MSPTDSSEGRVSAQVAIAPLWRSLVAGLRTAEADLRLDRPGAVHGFRLAARRLRSDLGGLRPLLDPDECDALAKQLRATGREVSGARDAEVIQRRVDHLLAAQPQDDDLVATRALLHRLLAGSYEQSREQALDYLDGEEYDAFTRRLERFADLPPWRSRAQGPAKRTLKPLLRRQWSRLRTASRKAVATEPGPVRDERLHDARKAAKRSRYLAEALTPVLGRRAERLGTVAARAQKVLGHYQDAVITTALLADAGEQAFRDGENGFALGRMQAEESAAMTGLYADFTRVVETMERKTHRRWLD